MLFVTLKGTVLELCEQEFDIFYVLNKDLDGRAMNTGKSVILIQSKIDGVNNYG